MYARRRLGRQRDQGKDGWFNIGKEIGLKFRWPGGAPSEGKRAQLGLLVRGPRSDVPITFEGGGALPGDRIVGVLTEGEGIRIFQIHSPKLKEYEHQWWIDVTWWDIDPSDARLFLAKLSVTAPNEPGTLAEIAQVIGEAGGHIGNVRTVRRAADLTEMAIEVKVRDLDHLNRIIKSLRGKPIFSKVERVFG
jgi:GTP pyrophosphokinase